MNDLLVGGVIAVVVGKCRGVIGWIANRVNDVNDALTWR